MSTDQGPTHRYGVAVTAVMTAALVVAGLAALGPSVGPSLGRSGSLTGPLYLPLAGAPEPGPTAGPPGGRPTGPCGLGPLLVPTCGVLWGTVPRADASTPSRVALRDFEATTGRTQAIFHAYHRGTDELFPTPDEIAIAREPGHRRLLLLNWKPTASWARIADGRDAATEAFLDRLARHITTAFPEPFFLTVHHEPENDVLAWPGSGYTAGDFAAMFRHVVTRLRAAGATNVVTVVVHMAYPPWNVTSWFNDLYPGDDVVDWVGWDVYAYSDPGYGHGDFAEMMNRRIGSRPGWPGFYNWASARHPDKPLMVAEWGVWRSEANPGHQAAFYRSVAGEIGNFPRVRALVHFTTPSDQQGRNSCVDSDPDSLSAFRDLGADPMFQVRP